MPLFPFLLPTLFSSGEPSTQTYDEIRMNGELIVDEMQFFNTDIDDSVLFQHGSTSPPTWTVNTILLMSFENNLDAGNFPTVDDPVTSWRILRREVGETEFTFLEEVDNTSVNVYFDVRASSSIEYEYGIQSVSNGTRGQVIVSEAVSMSFWGWALESLDYNPDTSTGTAYVFDVEIETGGSQKNRSRTRYDNTFATRPKVEYGNMEYFSETLNTIPKQCVNDEFLLGSNADRNSLETFLSDKQPKVLKNGSGYTIIVDVVNWSFKYLDRLTNDNTNNKYEQPFTINISFEQIADPADVL